MSEHASQNEIVWDGKVLHKNVQEHVAQIPTRQSSIKFATVYEIYSQSTNPQMVPLGYDSDDNEKKVANEQIYFSRSHDQENYSDGSKYPQLEDTLSKYFFGDKDLVSVSAQKSLAKNKRELRVHIQDKATFGYNPTLGSIQTIALPIPDKDRDPVFGPRITYNLESGLYVNREGKPVKDQAPQPEITLIGDNVLRIVFNNIEGINQTLTIPVSLKTGEQKPFDQFTDLNSNDWVDPKLLEVLHTFSIK